MKSANTQFLWYAVLSDSAGNETGAEISIAETINLEIDYKVLTRPSRIIKGNIYKIYCFAKDSAGKLLTKGNNNNSFSKNHVSDFILVRIDYPKPFGPNKPNQLGSEPEPQAKEPDEIIPANKGETVAHQPPGIITITAEKQEPVAIQRGEKVGIENPRAYELGYVIPKKFEPPRGTRIDILLVDSQTRQTKVLASGKYPLIIPIRRNSMPLGDYRIEIIFTYNNDSILADWFNLKIVPQLPSAYQVKGLLMEPSRTLTAEEKPQVETKVNIQRMPQEAILEQILIPLLRDYVFSSEEYNKTRSGKQWYWPNVREFLEKKLKTKKPLAVWFNEKYNIKINDKYLENFTIILADQNKLKPMLKREEQLKYLAYVLDPFIQYMGANKNNYKNTQSIINVIWAYCRQYYKVALRKGEFITYFAYILKNYGVNITNEDIDEYYNTLRRMNQI